MLFLAKPGRIERLHNSWPFAGFNRSGCVDFSRKRVCILKATGYFDCIFVLGVAIVMRRFHDNADDILEFVFLIII